MEGRRNPFVAREGIPFLLIALIGLGVAVHLMQLVWAGVAAVVFIVLFFVFRDPHRGIPASPLGVVSPVDGKIQKIELVDKGVLHGEAQVIHIRIDAFGTYTARAPVEGLIKDLRSIAGEKVIDYRTNALWLQTDEGEDIVLQFTGYRLGLAPRSFIRYGERVGQGQRCAYLRLTRVAEVHLPIESTILVEPGQVVQAGIDLIGKVPHP